MPDTKISELTAATTLAGTEVVPVVQSATTKKATITQLLALAQPLDSDLTAIAALSTTSFGRSLLALADAAAGRTALGLGTAATAASTAFDAAGAAAAAQAASQPVDSDLTAIAALTTTSFGRGLLALADSAALRTILGTGTQDTTTFLRGDGTWAVPAGGGGGAPTDATYVVTTANGTLSAEKVLGADVIMRGTLAARPAAGTGGRLYDKTDDDLVVQRDTGAAWDLFAIKGITVQDNNTQEGTGIITLDFSTGLAVVVTGTEAVVTAVNPTPPSLLRVVTVAYAATITPNVGTSDIINVGTLTGNLNVANPTGTAVDGQILRLRYQQDATGGRTVTYDTAWVFGTDVTSAMTPTTANAKWERMFSYHAGDAKWRALAIARGFA